MASAHASSSMRSEATLRPATYGKACVNCAKSKCKCLTRSGSSSCDRCVRLKRECISSESMRGRTKKTTSASLEEKVDGILSLLQSGAVAGATNTIESKTQNFELRPAQFVDKNGRNDAELQAPTLTDLNASPTELIVVSPASKLDHSNGSNINGTDSSPSSFTGSEPVSSTLSNFDFNYPEADNCLSIFKDEYLPYLGIVHIPANMTAYLLQQTRPFLFVAIMAVTSSSIPQRIMLAKEIKESVTRNFISDTEGNVDLLLGLLVFIIWGQDQVAGKHISSRLTHIAESMALELRLNKAPLKGSSILFNLGPLQEMELKPPPRTMEERRAVLGCYMMTSFVSWYGMKIDPMRWTPHMEESLQVLTNHPESPMDEILAHQVRLQLINERVSTYFPSSKTADSEFHETSKASLPFYMHAFQAELSGVRRQISENANGSLALQSAIDHNTISICALALSFPNPLSTSTSSIPQSNSHTHTTRLSALTTALTSLVSFFTHFFSIPASSFPAIPFPTFAHLVHSIVVLYRISVFSDPSWDVRAVRERLDVCRVLETLVARFRELVGSARDEEGRDIFAKLAWVFEEVRAWVTLRVGAVGSTGPDGTVGGGEEGGGGDMSAGGLQAEAEAGGFEKGDLHGHVDIPMDDAWLSEILGPWNYDFM